MVCSLNSSMASTDRITAGVPNAVSTFAVPSIMKLFDVGRAPMRLIALPTPWRIVPCSPSVWTAPAPRNSNDRKLRPLSGRSVICFSVITWPTEAVSVSRATVAACTSTVSVAAPTANVRSMRATWSTLSRMPDCLATLNPVSSALTEYTPVGRSGNE